MEKFIPYKKLSKKKQRELDAVRRSGWGALNPVSRKCPNGKAYNRKKAQSWKNELPPTVLSFMVVPFTAWVFNPLTVSVTS